MGAVVGVAAAVGAAEAGTAGVPGAGAAGAVFDGIAAIGAAPLWFSNTS